MLAIVLALSASVSWGLGDFISGLKSRGLPLLAVLLVNQVAGFALIALIVALRGRPPLGPEETLYAVLAGFGGGIGLAALLRGLAIGSMSVVAPIASTAAAVPVVFGLAVGERPSPPQACGLVLALLGVALASGALGKRVEATRPVAAGVGYALLAALGFGSLYITLDVAAESDALWAACVQRATAVALVLLAVLLARPKLSAVALPDLPALVAGGALDASATALYAAASTYGLVSITSVLSSLYPITTVILARLVLHERISRAQQVGVAAALGGVALIAGG